MANERLRARRALNTRQLKNIYHAQTGSTELDGVPVSRLALATAQNMMQANPLIMSYVRISPEGEGGLQLEMGDYPVSARITIDADSAFRITQNVGHEAIDTTVLRLERDIRRARYFSAGSAEVVFAAGEPVVERIMHGPHEIIAMRVIDDRCDAIGILLSDQTKADLQDRDIRDVMLDPLTVLFAINQDDAGYVGLEFVDGIPESCLPEADLHFARMMQLGQADQIPSA